MSRLVPPIAPDGLRACVLRYGVSAALVLGAVGLRTALFGRDGIVPFLPLFAAVVVSGMLFDRWTGVFATVLGAGVAAFFFVAPLDSFVIGSAGDGVALLAFTGFGLVAAVLLEVLHAVLRGLRE